MGIRIIFFLKSHLQSHIWVKGRWGYLIFYKANSIFCVDSHFNSFYNLSQAANSLEFFQSNFLFKDLAYFNLPYLGIYQERKGKLKRGKGELRGTNIEKNKLFFCEIHNKMFQRRGGGEGPSPPPLYTYAYMISFLLWPCLSNHRCRCGSCCNQKSLKNKNICIYNWYYDIT